MGEAKSPEVAEHCDKFYLFVTRLFSSVGIPNQGDFHFFEKEFPASCFGERSGAAEGIEEKPEKRSQVSGL